VKSILQDKSQSLDEVTRLIIKLNKVTSHYMPVKGKQWHELMHMEDKIRGNMDNIMNESFIEEKSPVRNRAKGEGSKNKEINKIY
jgi:hypothetical protein